MSDSPSNPVNKYRPIVIGRITWPLVWTIVILTGAEFVLELRASTRGFKTYLFGQPTQKFDSPPKTTPQTKYGPTHDFPFRSQIVEVKKQSNTIRIWIASSSHAEDTRTLADRIFPSIIQRKLTQAGFKCEVLNASRAGMTLEENAKELANLATTWNPDIVIAYQMSNDLVAGFNQIHNKPSANRSQGLPNFFANVDRIVEGTTFYEQLKSNVTSRINRSRVLNNDIPISVEQKYFEGLDQLKVTANKVGATFAVCTFALSHASDALPQDYELILLKTLPELSPAAWHPVVIRWNQKIVRQHDRQVIDVASQVTGNERYFRDPVHFTESGHEIVGHTIATALLEGGHLTPRLGSNQK